jgi:hypothetical protein
MPGRRIAIRVNNAADFGEVLNDLTSDTVDWPKRPYRIANLSIELLGKIAIGDDEMTRAGNSMAPPSNRVVQVDNVASIPHLVVRR